MCNKPPAYAWGRVCTCLYARGPPSTRPRPRLAEVFDDEAECTSVCWPWPSAHLEVAAAPPTVHRHAAVAALLCCCVRCAGCWAAASARGCWTRPASTRSVPGPWSGLGLLPHRQGTPGDPGCVPNTPGWLAGRLAHAYARKLGRPRVVLPLYPPQYPLVLYHVHYARRAMFQAHSGPPTPRPVGKTPSPPTPAARHGSGGRGATRRFAGAATAAALRAVLHGAVAGADGTGAAGAPGRG